MVKVSQVPLVWRRLAATLCLALWTSCSWLPCRLQTESSQTPPNFRENSGVARLSLVFATRGSYKLFGC